MTRYVRGVLVTEVGWWDAAGGAMRLAVRHRRHRWCAFTGPHPITECRLYRGIGDKHAARNRHPFGNRVTQPTN